MKKRRFLASFLIFGTLLMGTNAYTFDPPKKLKWGMSYDSVKVTLTKIPTKNKRLKVGKLKTEKGVPEHIKFAKVKKIKLIDHKVNEAYIAFDDSTGLCAVIYAMTWNNIERTTNIFETANKGRDNSWEYHRRLFDLLRGKYGEPNESFAPERIGTNVASGSSLSTVWNDSLSGDIIILAITRQKKNAVLARQDLYVVQLIYRNPVYRQAQQEALVTDEDI